VYYKNCLAMVNIIPIQEHPVFNSNPYATFFSVQDFLQAGLLGCDGPITFLYYDQIKKHIRISIFSPI
ncbi:MAG: hypothetical protein C0403_20135, partial [Desulfobacterium sp.]|nr:hypothetical protein [Desulfobacterium sp.]